MSFDFLEFQEERYLMPIELPNKKEYFSDLINVEDSFTGRLDAQITNKFIYESVQLVKNAIVLFEKGYFDCAYYSLRQSLELSTTMIYLIELEPAEKKEKIDNWIEKDHFPFFGQMINFLKKDGNTFPDIKEKMSDYFNELEEIKKKLNKYVHKQGFDTFYTVRSNSKNKEKIKNEFINYIKNCIGAIAVLRLAIDPLSVLLMDEEIYRRTWDTVTNAYSEEFIEKYIGSEHIKDYKRTDVYKGYFEVLISKEKMLPCVTELVKYQFIDKNKIDNIFSQRHLLSKKDKIAVLIADFSEKVAKIYFDTGLLYYFTNTDSVRKRSGFSTKDLENVKQDDLNINNGYDEAYLTYIKLKEENCYIEHNKPFEKGEIDNLMSLLSHFT